ncbi:hypothetical protein LBMAG42_41700 [Deltaproteobacteria bacterium]|nr:hypothetical protein LBMAG42_41700 [Deltaproteobacteria bacterium]
MKIGISNLAWPAGDDAKIAPILAALGVDTVDLAPGKYAARAGWPEAAAVDHVRRWWADFGISIRGVQSLFFGQPHLNLFGEVAVREAMLARFEHVAELAERLGASKLVFGSPGNRRRGAFAASEAGPAAIEFARRAGDIAAAHHALLCIEAAPVAYGGDFAVTTHEAAAWVEAAAHPAVRLQLDTGIATLLGEDFTELVERNAHLTGHIHVSEANLAILGDSDTKHEVFAAAIGGTLPHLGVTIEMLARPEEDAAPAVERAVRYALLHYGAS